MPMYLPPSRRQFLGAALGLLIVGRSYGRDDKTDPHRVAFLSDTHVGDTLETMARENTMADNLKRVVAEIAALERKPTAVVIDGDLAYKTGTADEYRTFAQLIAPLRDAGLPLHLGLGNHDSRDQFLKSFADAAPKDRPLDGKHVLVVETERANLFVLDSLEPKRGSNGECGAEQLKWLAKALDARPNKPAIVFVHHNLAFAADAQGKRGGVADVEDLWPILRDRKQVKAYVFGHTHTWKLDKKDDVHLINLPAIGYPFAKGQITGWVDVQLREGGASLEVRGLDVKHADHGKKVDLTWR